MKITSEEIKKIALLSRLTVKEEQMAVIEKQMSDILSYMDLIGEVDLTDVEPTAHAVPLRNVMRADEPRKSLEHGEALSNAPEEENGYFKVPKVLQD